MRLYTSIIDQVRSGQGGFKKAEARVARFILEDADRATKLSIKDLARAAGTSEPTVIRFARKMGCTGFSDLKLRLSQDVAVSKMFVFNEGDALPKDTDTVSQRVYEDAVQALAFAFAERDPEALDRAATAIHAAERVFCFGVGGSSANLAAEAENRLFRYDVHAAAIADPYRQRMAAGFCGPPDVLLIFSVTGKPRSLVESAEIARTLGACVIAVTRPNTPLAGASTIHIALDIPDHEKHYEIPHRSRYGQLYILDCLATLLGSLRLETSAPKLRRVRATLSALHGRSEQQPIGD